jgi:hypothetical protein
MIAKVPFHRRATPNPSFEPFGGQLNVRFRTSPPRPASAVGTSILSVPAKVQPLVPREFTPSCPATMGTMRTLLTAVALLATASCFAQVESSKSLARLYAEDQADRKVPPKDMDWSAVGPRDEARRASVVRILQAGEVRTAADYHAAAMIFQHGQGPEHIQMAYSLATIGSSMDPGNKGLKWLAAAAWDRFLMQRGKPQWYGTQYMLNQNTKRFELYQVDESAVTDKERAEHGVPPLAEAKAREAEFNR